MSWELFPLHVFPEGSLASSVITTVWVGVAVVAFFNLRFGWSLAGLVVPGYLVPLLLIKPWSVAVIIGEGMVTYLVVQAISVLGARYLGLADFFGRDRFFALVLTSVIVRVAFDAFWLPGLGAWVNQTFSLECARQSLVVWKAARDAQRKERNETQWVKVPSGQG